MALGQADDMKTVIMQREIISFIVRPRMNIQHSRPQRDHTVLRPPWQ